MAPATTAFRDLLACFTVYSSVVARTAHRRTNSWLSHAAKHCRWVPRCSISSVTNNLAQRLEWWKMQILCWIWSISLEKPICRIVLCLPWICRIEQTKLPCCSGFVCLGTRIAIPLGLYYNGISRFSCAYNFYILMFWTDWVCVCFGPFAGTALTSTFKTLMLFSRWQWRLHWTKSKWWSN